MKRRKFLYQTIRQNFSKQFVYIILLALVGAITSAPIPFLFRKVIDGINLLPIDQIIWFAVIYAGLIIIRVILDYCQHMVLYGFQYEVSFTVTTDIYKRILKLPFGTLTSRGMGDVVRLFQEDGSNLYSLITYGIINLITIVIQFIIDIVIIYILFGYYATAIIVIIPVYYLLFRKGARNVEEYGRDYEMKVEKWQSDSYSPLHRLKEVKSRRIELYLLNKIRESYTKVKDSGIRYGRKSNLLYSLYNFFDRGMYVLTFIIGIYAVINGFLTIGTLFAVFYVMSSVVASLNSLSIAVINDYQKRIPSLDRLVDLYSIEIPNPVNNPPDLAAMNIRFEAVEFIYEDSNFVLQIPQLTLSNNQHYVLIGKTGSGKSTFFDLLNGIRIPQRGKILINGIETSEIAEEWWKKNVFVLLQDVYLFRGSIEDNILMDEALDNSELVDTIEQHGFTAFFARFKDGLKTHPNEGNSLSGGEKRMISILRLLLKPQYRAVLIDEGKSGLDAELRNKIDITMESVLKNRLSVTITHDLNEISKYDEVIFIHNGCVTLSKHIDLMKTNNDYVELINQEFNNETV